MEQYKGNGLMIRGHRLVVGISKYTRKMSMKFSIFHIKKDQRNLKKEKVIWKFSNRDNRSYNEMV